MKLKLTSLILSGAMLAACSTLNFSNPFNRQEKYALLINGSDETRFEYETCRSYFILHAIGFNHVYFLNADDKASICPIDGKATKENIESIISELEEKIDENDTFVMHISDHGARDTAYTPFGYKTFTRVILPEEDITEYDVAEYISGIKPKLGIVTTDICYGGGIANRTGRREFIGISSTREDALGYLWINNSFSRFFYEAFLEPGENDIDNNGEVSISEAFEYAKKSHSYSRKGTVEPQLITDLDPDNITIE